MAEVAEVAEVDRENSGYVGAGVGRARGNRCGMDPGGSTFFSSTCYYH